MKELGVIAPLLKQARKNLTGNAKDLWVAGITNLEKQKRVLGALQNDIVDKSASAKAIKDDNMQLLLDAFNKELLVTMPDYFDHMNEEEEAEEEKMLKYELTRVRET